MSEQELRELWLQEERIAHVRGWDLSHIHDRYEEEKDLPWDFREQIEYYLTPDMQLMDYDTGGGEFLLSLGHPHKNTAATEGYGPNVQLCADTLLPLGIDFKECSNASNIPYPDESFDVCMNRHGEYDPREIHRLLKPGGIFITQQVGSENDRDLVEMVLPGTPKSFPENRMSIQRKRFIEEGFEILFAKETYRSIRFYDVGAFVWFARIIEWEFPGFSVDRCFPQLMQMQKHLEHKRRIDGTIHRFILVARKK